MTTEILLGIAADHRGFKLKQDLLTGFRHLGIEMIDFGASTKKSDDDYPDYVFPMARAISNGNLKRGIAICGSGVGASIAANKIKNVRAALIHDLFSARQGVEDDDMNIICLGALLVTFPLAMELIQVFFKAQFLGEERQRRRLAKIAKVEKSWM